MRKISGRFGAVAIVTALMTMMLAAPIAAPAQTFSTLVSFDGTDGASPQGVSLVQGTDGNLYGTTALGGTNGEDTVFRVGPTGTVTTLYSFCAQPNCADGSAPVAGLMLASDGNLYGTTLFGGASSACSLGCGTVFRITEAGTLVTLQSFNQVDGGNSEAGLVQGTDGNLYGTTAGGGVSRLGTVFKITLAGALTVLHSFDGTDGKTPASPLALDNTGHFYGTTNLGGANGEGTVFRISSAGSLTTLYSFCAKQNCDDGSLPIGGVVWASDGNLYGTTSEGGVHAGAGTIFRLTPNGQLTTLSSFNTVDGALPEATLIQGTDGKLYGTTVEGGSQSVGTFFNTTLGGELTTIHSFDSADGSFPYGGLVQATDGSFYRTTFGGGASDLGTVFSLSVGFHRFVETDPMFGRAGTTVIILGNNLTGASGVTFNGTPATFTIHSKTVISAVVPAGATTGLVQVSLPSGTLSSNVPFRVLP